MFTAALVGASAHPGSQYFMEEESYLGARYSQTPAGAPNLTPQTEQRC